jgi:hypothetical protein
METIKNYTIGVLTLVIIALTVILLYEKEDEREGVNAPVFQFRLAETESKSGTTNYSELATVSKTYIRLYRNEIKKAAKYWNVPASSLAGIICAESSLNFDGAHRLEEYYFKKFILTKNNEKIKDLIEEAQTAQLYNNRKSFFSKIHNPGNWSLGLCQMQITVGLFTDSLMAMHEQRQPYTEKKVINRLLHPATNINYCACYLNHIIEKYRFELNVDLKQRPSLLVTIYNIGELEKLIDKRKNAHDLNIQSFSNNHFGRFIEAKRHVIDSLIYEVAEMTTDKTTDS